MSDVSVSLDLDAQQMYRELTVATQRLNQAASRMEQSGNRAGAGVESIIRGERRVVTGVRNLSGVLLSGGDAGSYLAAGLESAYRILRLPLTASVGIIGAAVGIIKTVAAVSELKKATTAVREELGKPIGGSIEQLQETISSTTKSVDDLQKKLGFLAVGGEAISQFGIATPNANKALEAQIEAYDRIFAASAKIAELTRDQQNALEITANKSQRQGELLKVQIDLQKKLADNEKLQADKKILPDAKAALDRKAKAEAAIAEQAINDKFNEKDRRSLEERDVRFVKTQGEDVDIKLAEGKEAAARGDLFAARTDEEKKAAQDKIDAAQFEVEEAKRATAEKRAQQALAEAQANLQSEGDKRHEDALKLEEQSLRDRLSTARPDEARELNVDLAKNLSAQRDIAKARADALRTAQDDTQVLELQSTQQEQLADLVKIQLDYEEKIRKARENGDAATAAQLQRQQQLATATKANTIVRSNRERGQLSLEELANSNLIGGVGGRNPGAEARAALREQELGRQAALRGDLAGSLEHQNRADQIKRGIDVLKDSEKNLGGDDFKNALDSSQVLQDIKKGVEGSGTNQ